MAVQNYHRHTCFSNIVLPDSVVQNEDYCRRAVELGAGIISSCEHGTPGNYWECSNLAEKYGLKWRYVMEAYFVLDRREKDDTNAHLILAAKTRKGMGDLNEVFSEANISGYYSRPRIDLELLMNLDPKDVFVTTACIGGVFKYGFKKAEELIAQFHSHFRDSFMLEVQYHNTEKQKEVNQFLLNMYRKYNIPLIAGLDSHYIFEQDKILRDQRLEASHLKYEDESGFYMDYPSDDEIFYRFEQQNILSRGQIQESMSNTDVFLDFEDITFDKSKKLPTLYPNLSQEERNQKYRDLVYSKWEAYKKTVPPEKWAEYEEGIAYEVNTITSTNTSDYFLLDYEIVKKAKANGGMLTYTGRGSSPSFFTNMLLGFTSIDRFALPVTMYPDRFISADRLMAGNLPDIDLNCGDVAPFAKAQADLMGEWKSAPMVAFGTLKRSSAWKMYCRACNVSFDIANEISSRLKEYDRDVKYAKDEKEDSGEEEEINVYDYVPERYHEQLRMSERYLGVVDNISPHPCAHIICQNDIRREIGVLRIKGKQGRPDVFTAWIDGATAESFGYLKNDLLKVDVVKVIAKTYSRIGIPQPTVSELMKMTANDRLTWDIYARGYTMCVNQVEKEKSKEKAMRYKPKNLTEMSALVAGIRPAFQSMINTLLDRRHFDYGIPALDNLLQTKEMPSSFILYQEQMMSVLQYAGFTGPQSYAAIKAIAKKHPEKVLPLKNQFLEGFEKRLIDESHVDKKTAEETSLKVWTIMSDACSYGFNSCLAGDEKMYLADYPEIKLTIEQMHSIVHDKAYARYHHFSDLRKEFLKNGFGHSLSLNEEGRLCQNRIMDIRFAGWREVYDVVLESGRFIRATMNHKFPVGRYDNLVKLEDMKVGDSVFCVDKNAVGEKVFEDRIVKIRFSDRLDVYDVEMESPFHNFVLRNGIVTGNSHSAAVALDSMYVAWAKAHHPLETYGAILSNYGEKKDKDRIDLVKNEMQTAFGIHIVPCKFRQDNREFFVDVKNNTISKALVSVKTLSQKVAETLYNMRNDQFDSFVSVLEALEYKPAINRKAVDVLIRMDYFSEFGSAGKLLEVFSEFKDGKNQYKKTYVEKTKTARLAKLKEFERNTPEKEIPPAEKLKFEIEYFGSPVSVYPEMRGKMVVVDIDTTYSPKIWLYNIAKGTMGMMKVRKAKYQQYPLAVGDIIRLYDWDKKPAYQYSNGQRTIKIGVYELWMKEYFVETEKTE